MKRLIIVLSLFLLIGCIPQPRVEVTPVEGKELRVGDKMPTLENSPIPIGPPKAFSNIDGTGTIWVQHWHGAVTKDCLYHTLSISCTGSEDKWYGIYNFETDTLYLDNGPMDNLIDEIVYPGSEKTLDYGSPSCI